MTFQLRPSAPPPPAYTPPGYPAAGPPGYAPPAGYPGYAPPSQATAPAYAPPAVEHASQPTAPVESPEWAGSTTAAEAQAPAPRRRRRGSRSIADLITALVVVGGVLGVLAMIIVGGWMAFSRSLNSGERPAYESPNFPWTFRLPAVDGWESYDAFRGLLDANGMALRRKDPTAWFALRCIDTRGRPVPDDELLNEARQKVNKAFNDVQAEPLNDVDFAGQKVKRLIFSGSREEEGVEGEVITFHKQGISYWFFFWTPADRFKQTRSEFDTLLARFTFKDRKTNDRSAVRDFFGDGYQLQDTYELWDEKLGYNPSPKFSKDLGELTKRAANLWQARQDDPKADMALVGGTREERKTSARQTGSALVLLLDKPGPDPVATAREYVLASQKTLSGSDAWKLEDLPLTAGSKDRVGEAPGHVVAAKLTDGNKTFLLVLGITPRDTDLLVIRCRCDWNERRRWEPEFVRLIDSYKVGPPRDAKEKEEAAKPDNPADAKP
jgi:hypothetical protein